MAERFESPACGFMAAPVRMLLLISLLLLLCCAGPVSAHAPLTAGDNGDLASAMLIEDPTKSWALYSELGEGGEAHYYRLEFQKGDRISASLFTTTSPEDEGFRPLLILMGPGITESDTLPSSLEVPPNVGILAVPSSRATEATFEGFSPSAFVELARISLDAPAEGTYYLVVWEETSGGHYGLAVGNRESFTITEWILLPFSLISIYLWERQNPLFVLAPAVLVIVAGAVLVYVRTSKTGPLDSTGTLSAIAGLLYLGTGATVFSQLFFVLGRASPDSFMVVTLVLGIIPLLLGLGTLGLAVRHPKGWSIPARTGLLVMALLALATWSGYLLGPILAFIAGIIPSFRHNDGRDIP